MKRNAKPRWLRFVNLTTLVVVGGRSTQEIWGGATGPLLWLGVAFFGFLFLGVNLVFAQELMRFVQTPRKSREAVKEFIIVFLTGISNVFIFAFIYSSYGIASGTDIIKGDLVTSLYFSIVTWTTLGYGDFSPLPALRLVAAFEAFLGYLYMAILVGMFLDVLQYITKTKE